MHKLLVDAPGESRFLLGNDAIARGAIEAGVAVAATYPGTPSSELSLSLFQVSRETDLYFEYSTNEKVAMEVAAAAANCGLRSMAIMKHVGLNVAADALMTLAYVGVRGAMVILSADDPSMFSSQNEQDNRYYAWFAGLPMLEPSSVAEARTMTLAAFDLSESLGVPVILRTTTRINHSNASVPLGPIRPPEMSGEFIKDPMSQVVVPAVARKLHGRLLEAQTKASAMADTSEFNWLDGSGSWGVVCNGVSHTYVTDAIADLGIADRVRVLRLGFSHPFPEALAEAFLNGCERVLVVEEGEPVMENALRSLAQARQVQIPIQGKGDTLFSRLFEFDPAMVRRCLATYFGVTDSAPAPVATDDLPPLPVRPPTLCAGCSHRATFYAVRQATIEAGIDPICPTDIGCYTLGFLPPLTSGDFLICMGSSTGTAGGFATATGKPVISFIGDSTFFHSGIAGLVNAVFNKHRFTLVILDNGTTAMTGHQPHPGVDMSLLNMNEFGRISIEAVVRALGVDHVAVIEPYKVRKSVEAIKEAVAVDGVSVVIAKEMCTLYANSLKLGSQRAFTVSDKCTNHRTCLDRLACPAFYLEKDRVRIDADLCTGCAVCAQICPENAIRPVKRG